MRVLFVCTGNTCRSPMAEAILKEIAKEKDISLEVKSAGLFALDGDKASRGALHALRDKSDITKHRAKSLDSQLIQWADIVLTMTQSQMNRIKSQYNEYENKIYLLHNFASNTDKDIEDPYGGSVELYKAVYDEIKEALLKIIDLYNGRN